MKKFLLKNSIYIFGAIAFLVLLFWLFYNPVSKLKLSIPGMDKGGNVTTKKEAGIKIGENFKLYKEVQPDANLMWPRFRGADIDNISKEKILLLDKWGTEKVLWKLKLGEGHAAPAVYEGRMYLMDYMEDIKSDALRCFDMKTGEELWRRWYKVKIKRNHGISRTVPAVTDKYVLTIGPRCHVMCVDRLKGDFLWGIDLEKDYETEVPFWYTGQCPLIDNDTAVIGVGGKALLIGVDCKTGKKVWETPNTEKWKMSHSSVIPITFKGKKMYIYCAVGGMVGVSASGNDKGKILWKTTKFSPNVIAPSPLVLDNGKIFMTAGYGAGGALYQLKQNGNNFDIEIIEIHKPSEGLACEQQTPVFSNGFIYGILPKDAGANRNQFVVCNASNVQKFTATSGKETRFGLGPYLLADGKFYILDDEGDVTIAKATATSFTVLDKKKILDGQDAWGPLVITGGYMILRDSKNMMCLDIRK